MQKDFAFFQNILLRFCLCNVHDTNSCQISIAYQLSELNFAVWKCCVFTRYRIQSNLLSAHFPFHQIAFCNDMRISLLSARFNRCDRIHNFDTLKAYEHFRISVSCNTVMHVFWSIIVFVRILSKNRVCYRYQYLEFNCRFKLH